MPEVILSVSEFVELINQTLEFAYPNVVVEGEVSEFEVKQEKWIHFRLKDEATSVECFMTVWGLKLPIEDGMKIRVVGHPKLTKWGRFSLNVRVYELAGEGALRKAYELLKQKLANEGLFDESRKRTLPPYPKSIGLITSHESDAYKDFIKILNERWRGVVIRVAPVQVQGATAPDQIVAAINYFNQLAEPVEVLVLTRGGGSLEDLQAFSTEPVARAIAASRTPTIVGVGHEADISLADLAADVRASTPTDAARKVVPNQVEIITHLATIKQQLANLLERDITQARESLTHDIYSLERFIAWPFDKLQQLSNRLRQTSLAASYQIERSYHDLSQYQASLKSGLTQLIKDQINQLVTLSRTLVSVDPSRVLARGYAIARKAGQIVRSASGIKLGDELVLQLAKDQLKTEVKDVQADR